MSGSGSGNSRGNGSANSNGDFCAIARIVNTQGHKGEIRAVLLTDFPERFTKLRRVFIGKADANANTSVWRPLHISSYRFQKQFVILSFDEIPDMNAAETIKGLLIGVPADERWPLPEGHYYIDDLIGMEVFEADGHLLGTVREVLETGSNAVLSVMRGKQEVLIPMLKSVIKSVDLSRRVINAALPPGLLEDDQDAH
jgi:16S rRNA processing protein RimM